MVEVQVEEPDCALAVVQEALMDCTGVIVGVVLSLPVIRSSIFDLFAPTIRK